MRLEVDGEGVDDGLVEAADVDGVGGGEFVDELGVGAFDGGVIFLAFGPIECDFEGGLRFGGELGDGAGELVVGFHADGVEGDVVALAGVEGVFEEDGLGAGGDVGDGFVVDDVPGGLGIGEGIILLPGFAAVAGVEEIDVSLGVAVVHPGAVGDGGEVGGGVDFEDEVAFLAGGIPSGRGRPGSR